MTKKECKKFTAGFFKAFSWKLKTLKEETVKVRCRFHTVANNDDRLVLVQILRDYTIECGNLRMELNTIFRLAKMEARDYPEYEAALRECRDADLYIFGVYTELKKLAQSNCESQEQG